MNFIHPRNVTKESLFYPQKSHSAFTLIELLVVMGILGVLMAVTILVINPNQYVEQARDTNRVTDMENLHKAISMYMASNPGGSFGITGDVYVSLPSTQPNCSDLGLPTGPTYHCVTAANLTKTDGTGWIPVNLFAGGFSSPLPKLPIDPINTVANGKYYTYVPNYQLTATLESTKYAAQYPTNLVAQGLSTNTPAVILGRGTTATTMPTIAIGDSYGGGIVAYFFVNGDPGYVAGQQHGLIAAAADQSTGIYWHVSNDGLTGASGTALGTGNANTNAIVSLYGAESNAARLCYDLSLNTYTDWYLPSIDELNKLYLNKVAIGGFSACEYGHWSSTEDTCEYCEGDLAWDQDFNTGDQYTSYKYYPDLCVRCVRSF